MTRNVLVTGAAGLLGGEIAHQLSSAGWAVTALINRNPEVLSNSGQPVAVRRRVHGDITQPRLGLGDSDWQALAAETDMVIHCAAITEFTEETPAHRAVNVFGTQTVIDFCDQAEAALVHVSTAYIAGDRNGVILETEDNEGQGFTNGYEATKFEAEMLVKKSRVRWSIARPSIVLGDSTAGRIRSFDTIYPILKVFAEGWVKTMPASPGASLNLVPIDHVCGGILQMAERFGDAQAQTFHLCSSRATPLEAFPETLLTFDGLAAPKWVAPEDFDLAALRPAERRFFKRGAEVYADYFSRSPEFDDSRFRSFSGTRGPEADKVWWRKLVAYAIEAGFIKPRKEKRT